MRGVARTGAVSFTPDDLFESAGGHSRPTWRAKRLRSRAPIACAHRNGEWRWVSSRATARVDKHGRLLRLVGVELDITERKIYEEALFP